MADGATVFVIRQSANKQKGRGASCKKRKKEKLNENEKQLGAKKGNRNAWFVCGGSTFSCSC